MLRVVRVRQHLPGDALAAAAAAQQAQADARRLPRLCAVAVQHALDVLHSLLVVSAQGSQACARAGSEQHTGWMGQARGWVGRARMG